MLRRKPLLLAALSLLLGCGDARDLPHSSEVSLAVVPSAATIPIGQSVVLVGTATGFSKPTISWWEQDQHDAAINGYGEEDCDDINSANLNLIPSCNFGYLTGSAMTQAATEIATYHAPNTPGTYHITFRAFQMSLEMIGASVEKRAAVTIIVTP